MAEDGVTSTDQPSGSNAEWYEKGLAEGFARGAAAVIAHMNHALIQLASTDLANSSVLGRSSDRETTLRDLRLPSWLWHTLARGQVVTINDALDRWHELDDLRGFGPKGRAALHEALVHAGYLPPPLPLEDLGNKP